MESVNLSVATRATNDILPTKGAGNEQFYDGAGQLRHWNEHFCALFAEFGVVKSSLEFATYTEAEIVEAIAKSDEIAAEFGVVVSHAKWMSIMELSRLIVCYKHMKCRKAFLGAVIMNNIAFLWDDLTDEHLDSKYVAIMLKKAKEVCREYYKEDVQDYVLFHFQQWMCFERNSRLRPELRLKLCTRTVTSYWEFRLIDSGVPFLYAITAPIYEDENFTASLFYLSQLVLKLFMMINDVYSWRKEVDKDCANFMHHAIRLRPEEQDAMVRTEITSMRNNMQTLLEFDEVSRDIALHSSFGNLLWSEKTPRYAEKADFHSMVD